jgi:hypothetical protein
MHIVKLNGGLGNQMFQYAFALALEHRYGGVKLDLGWIRRAQAHNGFELDRHFRIKLPVCSEEERRALGDTDPTLLGRARRKLRLSKRSQFSARSTGWDPRFLKVGRDSYFSGYWQSYKYYSGFEEEIREAFDFIEPLSARNQDFLGGSAGRTLIGVHVRRGDYLTNRDFSGVCNLDYYREALRLVTAQATSPLIAFFSDDLNWCRDNLSTGEGSCFVDWNRGEESYADMRLMKACDGLVIANSSFSWWAAWLGERAGRVVAAPGTWYGGRTADNPDIAPPSWKRINPA